MCVQSDNKPSPFSRRARLTSKLWFQALVYYEVLRCVVGSVVFVFADRLVQKAGNRNFLRRKGGGGLRHFDLWRKLE